MRPERQRELLARVNAHRRAGRSTDEAEATMTVPTATYTDPDRLAAERRLLSSAPTVVGLSGLLPTNRSYATVDVGGSSVIVTRNSDGHVSAMFNVCRHRGSEITSGCGEAARLACPYHGWTYHLDGTSAARRRDEYFDGAPTESLTSLPVLEQHGIIWVSGDPDVDDPTESAARCRGRTRPVRPCRVSTVRFDQPSLDRSTGNSPSTPSARPTTCRRCTETPWRR